MAATSEQKSIVERLNKQGFDEKLTKRGVGGQVASLGFKMRVGNE